jgi:hypothetical protein
MLMDALYADGHFSKPEIRPEIDVMVRLPKIAECMSN